MTTKKSYLETFMAMIEWGQEADMDLSRNGARNEEGDWPPVVRMTGDNGRIELLLTAKMRPQQGGGTYVFGLVDLGNGNPEVGPINLAHYIADPQTDPKPLVEVDLTFKSDPNGKTISQILADKRAKLAQK